MAEYTISVLLTSEDDATKTIEKFSSGLDDVSKSADKLEESTEKTGDGLFSLENIVKGAGAAISIDLAKQAAQAVFELGELGAQSLRTKSAFDAISGGAGIAAENLDAMKAATRGAMSEADLMASANQLMQMGLASNADELARVTQMATKLGGAMGTDATASIENFSMMLANQSLPRLDTFGISSGKVRARIAELQEQTKGLSRETAFMTAVMEQGEAAMSRLGDSASDELLAFEQLDATIANLKTTVAEKAAPAVSQFAGTLNMLLTWNERLADATAEHADEVYNTAESYDEYRSRMEQIAVAQGKVINAEGQLVSQGNILNKTIIGLIAPIEKVVDADYMMSESAFRAAESSALLTEKMERQTTVSSDAVASTENEAVALMESGDALQLYKEALEAGGASARQTAFSIEQLSSSLGITTTAEQQAQLDAQLLSDAFESGTMTAFEFGQKLEGVTQGTIQLTDAERAAIQGQITASQAAHDLARAHEDAATAAAGQAQETLALAGSLKDATSTQIAQQMIGMLDPEKMGAEAYSTAVKDIGLSFGIMDEESIAMSENIGILATMIEEGTIPIDNADEALSALIEDARDGAVNIDKITDEFSDVKRPADEATTSIDGMSDAVIGTGTTIVQTQPQFDNLNSSALQLEENFMRAKQQVWGLIDAIENIPSDSGGGGGGGGYKEEYQHGTDYVPRTGLAYLHQGEMVIPSQRAQKIREGQGEKTIVLAPIILQADDYTEGGELDLMALAREIRYGA